MSRKPGVHEQWLVTGGAGYIGAHVCRALLARGEHVTVLDSMVSGIPERLPRGVTVLTGRVGEIPSLMPPGSGPSIKGIIHLAAFKNARESRDRPLKYWENNVGEFITLLRWVVDNGVPNFVLSSSSSVFGSQAGVTEESEIRPISPYGATKATCEAILSHAADAYGLAHCSLRYFNVVGSGDFPLAHDTGVDNVVPRFVEAVRSGRPIEVYGATYETNDGSCLRDYIDVRDLAEVHALIAGRLSSGTEVPDLINVGSGSPTSVLEIARMVSDTVDGREVAIEIRAPHSADPAEVWARESPVLKAWGWRPQHDLRDSIQAHLASIVQSSGR